MTTDLDRRSLEWNNADKHAMNRSTQTVTHCRAWSLTRLQFVAEPALSLLESDHFSGRLHGITRQFREQFAKFTARYIYADERAVTPGKEQGDEVENVEISSKPSSYF